jgi:hypothetical protein
MKRVVITSIVNFSRADLRSVLSCKCIWGLEWAAAAGVECLEYVVPQ